MPLPGLLSMQRHLEADSAPCNNSDTAKKRPPLSEKNLPAKEPSGGFLPVSSMLPPGGGVQCSAPAGRNSTNFLTGVFMAASGGGFSLADAVLVSPQLLPQLLTFGIKHIIG